MGLLERKDVFTATRTLEVQQEQNPDAGIILASVYDALSEKGYDPVSQIVGFIMSGDPTYITNHKRARSLIMKADRDDLVEELLKAYIRDLGREVCKAS